MLACGNALTRLEAIGDALDRMIEALPEPVWCTMRLGCQLLGNTAVITFKVSTGDPFGLGCIAIGASGLAELRQLPVPNDPDAQAHICDHVTQACDAMVAVESGGEAIHQLRVALGMSVDARHQMRLAMPIPVRFTGPAGRSVGSTNNLSTQAAFIRTAMPVPALWSSVPVAFVMGHDCVAPEILRGHATVVFHRTGPGAGFGARLVLADSTRADLERAVDRLREIPKTTATAWRGEIDRPGETLDITFATAAALAREYSRNICAGRMFVTADTAPALDSDIVVRVTLPDDDVMRLTARVTRIIDIASRAGCQLAVDPLVPEAQAKLERFVMC